jgi:2-succinyl-5-enolpyruvyl-6-hydroxy-3-cyclohexene-1-carboxylate synthase
MPTAWSPDLRNTNALWASVLVETIARCGVGRAVICPGSRSSPLAIAFAAHPAVEAIPVLDERSAAFFALGLAKPRLEPVALVCTSGTAAANFYPAVIEAYESNVPLLVLTADRPPELRASASGQTIDQQKLYGGFAAFHHELAVPGLDDGLLRYLRQTMMHAVARTLSPAPGPVHLNVPFRDPLAPVSDGGITARFAGAIDWQAFFEHLGGAAESGTGVPPAVASREGAVPPVMSHGRPSRVHGQAAYAIQSMGGTPMPLLRPNRVGVIVAGAAQPANPEDYTAAAAGIARRLGWPVLADGLSPLRHYASRVPNLVTTYDLILRNRAVAERLRPEAVLCLGTWPTSKVLRAWIEAGAPNVVLVSDRFDNRDPLHARTRQVSMDLAAVAAALPSGERGSGYSDVWQAHETRARQELDAWLRDHSGLFEPKAAWLLAQHLPAETPLVIGNSMPIRDVEYVWPAGNGAVRPFCNRGANGIDGTLSTALGVAHGVDRPAVLLTGDLALLHDSNGFLLGPKLRGSLTVIVVNNRGGGIFEHLPIAGFEPPFEEFFATPQEVDLARLCAAHGVAHVAVQDWAQFAELVAELPARGIRVLELGTDRKRDAAMRKRMFAEIAARLG